jgi:hypothetical protein
MLTRPRGRPHRCSTPVRYHLGRRPISTPITRGRSSLLRHFMFLIRRAHRGTIGLVTARPATRPPPPEATVAIFRRINLLFRPSPMAGYERAAFVRPPRPLERHGSEMQHPGVPPVIHLHLLAAEKGINPVITNAAAPPCPRRPGARVARPTCRVTSPLRRVHTVRRQRAVRGPTSRRPIAVRECHHVPRAAGGPQATAITDHR